MKRRTLFIALTVILIGGVITWLLCFQSVTCTVVTTHCADFQPERNVNNERIFYKAEKRSDSYIISMSTVKIKNGIMLMNDAVMEPYLYLIDNYVENSNFISFSLTDFVYYTHLYDSISILADTTTYGKISNKLDSPEDITISRIDEFIWQWNGPQMGDNALLIDSVDLVRSGYMTYDNLFNDLSQFHEVKSMNRTFFGVDESGIDTTCYIQIKNEEAIYRGPFFCNEPDSTGIYEIEKVLVRNKTEDVIRIEIKFVRGAKYDTVCVKNLVGDTKAELWSRRSKGIATTFLYRTNDNPLIWEDLNNLDCFYVESVDVAAYGASQKKELDFVYHDEGMKNTELGKACHDNDYQEIKRIIKSGASLWCAEDGYFQYDAIFMVTRYCSPCVLEYLLENNHYQDINLPYTENGLSLVSEAASSEDDFSALEKVKMLIKAGANPNGCGYQGFDYVTYPLFLALLNNNYLAAKFLVDSGADIDVIDRQGTSIASFLEYSQVNDITKDYIQLLLNRKNEEHHSGFEEKKRP